MNCKTNFKSTSMAIRSGYKEITDKLGKELE